MEKIKKPNEMNNIISIKKGNNTVLVDKENAKQILESFYFTDRYNTKQIKKIIKNIEGTVRKSEEYKAYLNFLINEQNISSCSVFGNIESDDATLEFHHYPFTLYDIVEIVINKYLIDSLPFNSFTIVREVLNLHYQNKVGLVRLSKTVHELVHDGKIFINLDSVYGKVDEFINDYYNYIPEDIIEKYNTLIDMNEKKFDENILEVKKEEVKKEEKA